jgi:hypothetical protein
MKNSYQAQRVIEEVVKEKPKARWLFPSNYKLDIILTYKTMSYVILNNLHQLA